MVIRQLDYSSYQSLMSSVATLRDHLHIASRVLKRIQEFKRSNEILVSDKLLSYVEQFLSSEGLQTLRVKTARAKFTDAKDGSGGPTVTHAAMFGQSPLAYMAGIDLSTIQAASGSNGAMELAGYNADFIATLCLLPTSLLSEGQPVLADTMGDTTFMTTGDDLYDSAASGNALTKEGSMLVPSYYAMEQYFMYEGAMSQEAQRRYKNKSGQDPAAAFGAALNSLAAPARLRQIDHLVALAMDSDVISSLFREPESKLNTAQNSFRMQTLEGLAAFMDYVLQYPIMYSYHALKNTHAAMMTVAGATWELPASTLSNFHNFIQTVEHPIYDADFKAVLAAVNTDGAFPYAGEPSVMIEEAVGIMGYAELIEDMRKAAVRGPEGTFTDMMLLMSGNMRALINPLGVSEHLYFSTAGNHIKSARRYENLMNMITTTISVAQFKETSPESLSKAKEALNANPIPVSGSIYVIPRPELTSSVIMDDEAVGVPNTVRNTVSKHLQLQEEMAFRFFSNDFGLGRLNHTDAIGFDLAAARRMNSRLQGSWSSLYPVEIMDGSVEHVGDFSTLSENAVLSLIGGLVNRPGVSLRYDIQDPMFLRFLATTLSSFGCVIKTNISKMSISKSGWKAAAAAPGKEIMVIEGYGRPYGLNYKDLFAMCTSVSTSPDEVDSQELLTEEIANTESADPGDVDHYAAYDRTVTFLAKDPLDENFYICLVPLTRLPVPSADQDEVMVEGPIRVKVKINIPRHNLFIPIKYPGSFVRHKALLQLTTFLIPAMGVVAPVYASAQFMHLTGYILNAASLAPEFSKEVKTGFKLPSPQEWNYHRNDPFDTYSWYRPFVLNLQSNSSSDAEKAESQVNQLTDSIKRIKEAESQAHADAIETSTAKTAEQVAGQNEMHSDTGGKANDDGAPSNTKKDDVKNEEEKHNDD